MAKKTIDINIMLTVKKYVEEISKHYNIKEVYLDLMQRVQATKIVILT